MVTSINVQFTDSTQTVIESVFAVPQVGENMGVVPSTDTRYITFYDTMSPQAQAGMVAPGS